MADPASFIASWLTPSSLFIFIFVNLVIGTIAITSRFGAASKNQHHQPQRVRSFNLNHNNTTHYESELVRTPSLLERVTSFNLSLRKHDVDVQSEPENPELVRTPSPLERVASFNLSLHKHAETQHVHPEPEPEPEPEQPELVRTPSLLQRIQSINFSRLYRSDSTHREDPDTDSDSDSDPAGPGKAEMRKSASERGGSMDSEWEEEEEVEKRRPQTARVETTSWTGDEEVDAKADDFINSFKKQLRLQRIGSLLRNRGDEEVTRE